MIEIGKWYHTAYDQSASADEPETDDYALILGNDNNWNYETYNLTFYKSALRPTNMSGNIQTFGAWQIKGEVKSRSQLDRLWRAVASEKIEVRKVVRRVFK